MVFKEKSATLFSSQCDWADNNGGKKFMLTEKDLSFERKKIIAWLGIDVVEREREKGLDQSQKRKIQHLIKYLGDL